MNGTGRALAAVSGAVLLLASLTGALHSPFLLLVPVPLFFTALRLGTAEGVAGIVLAVLLLVAAEGLMGSLNGRDLAAALAAAAVLTALAWRVRRWLREGSAADRLGLRLPPADARGDADTEAASDD